eukprot:g312.t1
MDGYYSRNAFEELAELNKALPEGSELRQKTAEYIRYFYQDSKDLALLSATSDLLRDIRDGVLELSRGSQRLTAMDMSLLLEDILFRNASLGSEISGLEAMDRICYLEQATYATGFLAPWEYLAYQQNQWSLPDSGSMRLGRLLFSTEQSRRLLEWATNSVRVVYGDEVAMFASVAPMANGFVDDVVRSSILLPLGEHIELLSAYAAQKANLKNEISVVSNPSTMRGLNPGYAKGILEVMERATEDLVIDAKKIYVFDHPPADLKPVAGIATVSEGNMVSHVQLLARNLGIPNAVLSADNLQDLQKLAGQEVFYAVSPKGTIILKPAKKMTDEEKSLFTAQERKEEKVTVPLDKMDLSTRRVINLRELDAEDSGRWCGPKAANLGQLKKLFPDNVVEGLVIPFGIFREHMDQKMPGVNVDYSGVVITQNVTTGARNEVTAAFSRGVGGAVDGQRAETYTIFNQGTYALVSPAREPKYLYLPAEGGTARGSDAAQLPLLNDYNLKKIRELATFVDSNYPGSTGEITYDMEMGFKDDHLWLFQHEVVLGAMNGRMPVTGAMLIMDSIRLTFLDDRQEMMRSLPPVDEELQTQLEELFPSYRDRYSVSILDITPGKEVRYAEREPMIGYQPGSVGKLAVLAALFCELENIYVDCYDDRWMLMRTKVVPAGQWAVYDHHTVPFFDTEKRNFYKRQVAPTDEMTLYEWADHMVSVSNNGAASVLWREVILMRVFQQDYPELTIEEAEEYFRKTDRRELMDLATDVRTG